MALSARSLAQGFAKTTAPVFKSLGLTPAMMAVETYLALLSGRGSGSGWNLSGEIASTAAFVKAGPAVIFDVGANNGEWSRSLAVARNEPGDRFFLFECAPYCFEGIEKRQSQIPNMQLEKVAVSSERGTATLHLPTRGSGLASLHERKDVSVNQETYVPHEVPTIALDDFIAEQGLDRINLIKMDIEGHEIHVLHGAKSAISNRKIDSVMFEFGSANVNSRTFFVDFWNLFKDAGYSIYRIIPGGTFVKVDSYSEALEYFRGATNYLASLNPPRR